MDSGGKNPHLAVKDRLNWGLLWVRSILNLIAEMTVLTFFKNKFLFSVFYVFKLSRPCSELTTNRERSYFEYQFFRQIIGKWFSKFSFTQVFIDSHVFFGIESWRWNSHQWIRNCYNSFCRYDETLVLLVMYSGIWNPKTRGGTDFFLHRLTVEKTSFFDTEKK